jgi:hypothetical protein
MASQHNYKLRVAVLGCVCQLGCKASAEVDPSTLDVDGDGYTAESDCDDADASLWNQSDSLVGDVPDDLENGWDDIPLLCVGLCYLDVTGDVDIQWPQETLDSLSCLRSVSESLIVERTSDVTDLSALGRVETSGGLLIFSNSSLPDLTGLRSLRSPGDIWIDGNEGLTSLAGLEAIRTSGSLLVTHNADLANLSGLDNLEEVDGYLTIEENDRLSTVGALSQVDYVGLNMTITDNPVLPTSDAEALADAIDTIEGSVNISGNAE